MRTILISLAFATVTACGANAGTQVRSALPTTIAAPGVNITTLVGTVSLAQLVAACTSTASAQQAGAVVIRGVLQDSNAHAKLDVPCAVQLEGASGVNLAQSTLDSQTLNISDSSSGVGNNVVNLADVVFVGHGDAGLLIELTDPGDRIAVARGSFNYPLGISIRATGARTQPDSGGTIAIADTALTANGPTSAGLSITASTSKGTIQVANPMIDAPTVVILADRCVVAIHAQVIDCRSAALASALKQQAKAAGS